MRLVHLADYRYDRPGSFIPALRAILLAGRERGWRTEAVVSGFDGGDRPEWAAELEADGVPVRVLPGPSRRDHSRQIAELLDEAPGEPTILHTHFTTFDLAAALAAWRRPAVKVIWHEHTALSGEPAMVARNTFKFAVLGAGVEMIICPSADLARAVRRRLGRRSRVVFLPNAIDSGAFVPTAAEERAEAREALGIAPGQKMVLGFGWHWHMKGGDVFRATVEQVHRLRPEVVGVLVSEDERGTAPDDAAVRVIPLRREVRGLYAAADLFLAPSRVEGGTPYAVLEALSCGLPVVASRIAGHTFVCDGLESCATVDLEPGAVAAALERFLADPPDEAERAAARRRIESDFDLGLWSDRLVDIYLALFA